MNREIIDKNLRFDEGYRLIVYLDTEMNPTVGIGHKVRQAENLRVGDVITEAQLMDFYNHDLLHAEIGARHSLENFAELPDDVQNVLVEMCFNLGAKGLRWFKKMLEAAARKDWEKMAYEVLDSDAARKLPIRYNKYSKRIKEAAL